MSLGCAGRFLLGLGVDVMDLPLLVCLGVREGTMQAERRK